MYHSIIHFGKCRNLQQFATVLISIEQYHTYCYKLYFVCLNALYIDICTVINVSQSTLIHYARVQIIIRWKKK